jgi:hypothetical protein
MENIKTLSKTNKPKLSELVDNLDDVENKPPDYYEVVPFQDYSNYPNIDISINLNTNDKDTVFKIMGIKYDVTNLIKLANNVSYSKNKRNDIKIKKSELNKSEIIVEKVDKPFKFINEEKIENKINFIDEELQNLFYEYEDVNNCLKYMYNQYEVIIKHKLVYHD